MKSLKNIRGFLFDLTGVIYEGGRAIEGAVETIDSLKSRGIPFRFTTNTTTCSVETLHRKLIGMGLPIEPREIFSVTQAAARFLAGKGKPSLFLVLSEDTRKDFAGFSISDDRPDYVVLGEIGDNWSYDLLQRVFRMLLGGAELLALHKSRFWQVDGQLRLSVGAFAAALEYAAGKQAVVIGKPAPQFFQTAVSDLKLQPEHVAMVGDDIESDVGGAQRSGMKGILVKTGKYREDLVARSKVKPDLTIESVAAIMELL